MAELAKRELFVTVGTLLITNLQMTFSVKKTTKPEPNQAEIKIWNLNDDHRSVLEETQKLPAQIVAGYEDNSAQIFLGNLNSVWSEVDGDDIVTTITTSDGGDAYKKSRVNKTYAAGTPLFNVVLDLAGSMLLGPGNVAVAAAGAVSQLAGAAVLPRATTISGNSARELHNLLHAVGKEFSIQDGQLQIVNRRTSLPGQAVVLSPNSGLLGSPSVDSKGILSAQALLIPDLQPGKIVVIESKLLGGAFRIETVTFEGDLYGDTWFASIEGKRY